MLTTIRLRLISGWSWIRVLYLLIGVTILVQGIGEHQWILAMLGGYWTSMGLFNYGCAAGTCYTGVPAQNKKETTDVKYEQVK